MAEDWKEIPGDTKRKYQLYLCSREWGERREAVHRRANGTCERCRRHPIDAVHHLTYEHKYNEPLDDLQGICDGCHKFTHGRIDCDPGKDAAYAIALFDSKSAADILDFSDIEMFVEPNRDGGPDIPGDHHISIKLTRENASSLHDIFLSTTQLQFFCCRILASLHSNKDFDAIYAIGDLINDPRP